MEIYIEYLFVDNLVINSIIIYLTSKFANFKIKKKRIFFVGLFATLFSFVFPFVLNINIYLLFVLKLLAGLLITLTLKKYKKIQEVVLGFIFFISSTFLMGGVTYGMISVFNLNISVNGILINNFEFPMGLLILLVSIYLFLMIKLIKYAKVKNLHNTCIYNVVVKVGDNDYNINGLYDTGNMVYDNISKKPLLIISSNFYKKMINSLNFDKMFNNNYKNNYFKNSHYINIKTVSNNEKILVFEIDAIKVYLNKNVYKSTDVCVGVSKTNFNDFDCILHKDFLVCD